MKINNKKGIASKLMTGLLILAMVLTVAACGNKDNAAQNGSSQVQQQNLENNLTVTGTGNTQFLFTVTDKEGNETKFEVHTDKATVGEALQEGKLIECEESSYGRGVKTVNGIKADYDVDKTYWAFYIDGEYAMTGVDATNIEAGKSYAFKIEK